MPILALAALICCSPGLHPMESHACALPSPILQASFMPILVLAARLCPEGVEATLFATLMSILNGGRASITAPLDHSGKAMHARACKLVTPSPARALSRQPIPSHSRRPALPCVHARGVSAVGVAMCAGGMHMHACTRTRTCVCCAQAAALWAAPWARG